ncbi:MAG: carbohydrate kinase family protein [Acidobacteria bacterium]|nr:carbohydrate kinase family protein [Acidobacteriota bacterium]
MKRDRTRVVFVGVATEDAIAVVDRYPAADERVVADDVLFAGGGPAATAAVAAARLGIEVALVAAIGDDDAGERVIADLEREGVDVSGVVVVPGERTARSVVVISGQHQERAISNRPGPALQLGDHGVARALIESARWVHVDQHGWAPVREYIDTMVSPPRLSVDAGNDIPGYRQVGTAVYAPTMSALVAHYGAPDQDNDVEALLRRAVVDGAEVAVATSGAEGSFALTNDGALIRATIPPGPIVSTLGAGDVFHGALIAGLVRLEDGTITGGLHGALEYATVVASLSCAGVDGRSRIPDHLQTVEFLQGMTQQRGKSA